MVYEKRTRVYTGSNNNNTLKAKFKSKFKVNVLLKSFILLQWRYLFSITI